MYSLKIMNLSKKLRKLITLVRFEYKAPKILNHYMTCNQV